MERRSYVRKADFNLVPTTRRRSAKSAAMAICFMCIQSMLFSVIGGSRQVAVAANSVPTPPAAAAPPDDGQWTMPSKNYASTRFSSLDQINGKNVANLRAELTFSTGVNRGQEAAPIVVNNTMY